MFTLVFTFCFGLLTSVLCIPSIKFTLPIEEYHLNGLFENWNVEDDLFLVKYRLLYTKPQQQQQNDEQKDLPSSLYSEGFLNCKGQFYTCSIPVSSSILNSKPVANKNKDSDSSLDEKNAVQEGLKLLEGLENIKISHQQTRGTNFLFWEFRYKDRILFRKMSFIGGEIAKMKMIANFKTQTNPLPSFNALNGSLVFNFKENSTTSKQKSIETVLYIRCGAVEDIVSSREIFDCHYEITIETPRLCSSPYFRKENKQLPISEIQCSMQVSASALPNALNEHLQKGNVFAVDSVTSNNPIQAEEKEYQSFNDLLSTFSQNIHGEVKKSSKFLDIVLDAFDASGINTENARWQNGQENDDETVTGLRNPLQDAAKNFDRIIDLITDVIEEDKKQEEFVDNEEGDKRKEEEKKKRKEELINNDL